MPYFNFENGVTPINDTNLNAMQQGLMELVFPIGSTYITQSDTNPKDILKFGTWERFKGLVALGIDENDSNLNAIGKKGGEKEHKLTIEEMANHFHGGTFWQQKEGYGNISTSNVGGASNRANIGSVEKIGGDQPHNNMQPYEVTGYMWIRRA